MIKKSLPPEFLNSKVGKQLDKTIVVYDRQTLVVVKCKRSDDHHGSYLILYTPIRHGTPILPSHNIPATCWEICEKCAWNAGEEKNKKQLSSPPITRRQKQWKRADIIIYIYVYYIFFIYTIALKQVFR